MNISKVGFQTWLESAANYEKQRKSGQFSLKTISLLVNELNNPQQDFNSIHIAGSKGKGSVAVMCASILHEAGFSEGLYTSPHIIDFLERVGTAYGKFPSEVYEKTAEELIQFIENICDDIDKAGFDQASWFELITLFSFLCFKNAHIQWGVFETGLGGRFDATNVLFPAVSIITPIELEHTEYLGDTLTKIAGEKAGIIKPRTPVCISSQKTEVEKVLIKKAKEMHAPVLFIDKALKESYVSFEKRKMNVFIDFGTFKGTNKKALFVRPLETTLSMPGSVQLQNAALAALAVKTAVPEITEETIERGLSHAQLQGRFEILDYMYDNLYSFTVILDGAHTVNSVNLTLETYDNIFSHHVFHLLFACAYDKKIEEIAPLFFAETKALPGFITLTKPGEIKESNPARLADAFIPLCKSRSIPFEQNNEYEDAIKSAVDRALKDNAVLLVTGSFYLVAEVKKSLRQNRLFSPVEG